MKMFSKNNNNNSQKERMSDREDNKGREECKVAQDSRGHGVNSRGYFSLNYYPSHHKAWDEVAKPQHEPEAGVYRACAMVCLVQGSQKLNARI